MAVKPGKPIYAWTKKIGSQHGSIAGEPTTLCEIPMLGNNYSKPGVSWPDPGTDAPVCEKCKTIYSGDSNGS